MGLMFGHKSWSLFFVGNDVTQEVFNVAYHLKQDIEATWRMSSRKRRQMWKKILEQYAFEEKARPKR